ncbi:hypothetical protein ACIPPJ_05050 [Streptomyces sp. NPDC086091]|uniref:COG1470 family protein n=1 Tax=Streptomyces sp. NPDC086091 TaxID=3365751 RepID=UPI0037F9656E
MGAIVLLLDDDESAVPGEETRRAAQICNSGSVVDRFALDVLGDAKDWIRVEPSEINVFPDQSVGVELVFTPPRSAALPAGEVPYALRVMSHEDIEGSVVEETTVTVGPYTDFGVRLAPTTRRTRFGVRFHAVVDNRGNAPLRVRTYATDRDSALRFAIAYPDTVVAPGKGALLPVRARPLARRWRGTDQALPFQVAVVHDGADGPEERTADGAVVQAALLSDAVAKFVLSVAAAALALIALWLFVLEPGVESEARKQLPPVADGSDLPSGAPSAAASASGGTGAPSAGLSPPPAVPDPLPPAPLPGAVREQDGAAPSPGTSGNAGTDGGGGEASDGGGRAFDGRIEADAAPSASAFDTTARYTVPDDATLFVSDVVFENAAADEGVLRLQRGEQVLRRLTLGAFSNQDEHYDEPIRFGPGEDVVLAVSCRKPGALVEPGGARTCTPAAFFSGRLVPTPA